ncbi:MAG TPA: carboxyl transferase domain-containing protein [Burkholderiales bacterium]|nr:carboxyl transferase domain-containing protein [Burkholderiales bacterium]
MSWLPEIEEIHRRRALAEACGGAEAVAKHHAAGKLTVRERIAALLDSGSFREVGKLAGRASYDRHGQLTGFEPAPYVMGLGKIEGRPVAVGGEDYTIRAGTGFGSDRRKGGQGGFIEDLAYEYRIPLVNLIDGTGGTVNTAKRKGYTVVPGYGQDGCERSADLLGVVPVVSAVMGTTAGGPSMRAILSHWSIMVKGTGQIFAAGPPVVERAFGNKIHKDDLGGTRVAVDTAGTIDNVAEDEADCIAQIRRFLSYMPTNVWELPPVMRTGDPADRAEDALAKIVPRSDRQAYNMKKLVEMVVDRGSLFEIQPTFGRSVITALARMDGYVVGIVANNPMFGGIMDYKAARKQGHFIELCDMFNIPIVFFADIPGLMVGVESESDAILREGVRARFLGFQVSVPVFTVLVRKCYGVAGGGVIDRAGLNFKIAWPSGHWGSLPVEGGVKAAYKRDIEKAEDPEKREREIEEELRQLASPFRTAEAFAIEDLIDPRETRPYLCQFIEALQPRLKTQLGPKAKYGVRP